MDFTTEEVNAMDRLTIANAKHQLAAEGGEFATMFAHGSLEIEFYMPHKVDNQQPHARDEVYVIASGRGDFINGSERHAVEPGEVIFVPAGREHRFVDFSDDFATWVMFFGPVGGEPSDYLPESSHD